MKLTKNMDAVVTAADAIVRETKEALAELDDYADLTEYDKILDRINNVEYCFNNAQSADIFASDPDDEGTTKIIMAEHDRYKAIVGRNIIDAKNAVRDALIKMALKYDTTLPAGFYALPEAKRTQLVVNAWNRVDNDEYTYHNMEDFYSAFISELDYLTDVLGIALAA